MSSSGEIHLSAITASEAENLHIVNPNAEAVEARARSTFGQDVTIKTFASVAEYTVPLAREMAERIVPLATSFDASPDTPVLAALGNAYYGAVSKAILADDGSIELYSERWFESLNVATSPQAPSGMPRRQLLGAELGDKPTYVIDTHGDRRIAYDVTLLSRDVGQSPHWIQLRCQR